MAYFSGCYVMLNFQGVHLSRVFVPSSCRLKFFCAYLWRDQTSAEKSCDSLATSEFPHIYTEMFTGFHPEKGWCEITGYTLGRLTWNLRIHQYTPGRGKSSSKPSFPGSMLIFRGVSPCLPLKIPPKFLPARWINLTFFCCWKLMWMGSSACDQCNLLKTHRIHVWYIYLHLP